MSLKERTISGILWVSVQRFGTLAITFLSNIVLARLLSPKDYGMVGMLAIFIAIATAFIDGGFGSALIQKDKPDQKDYSTVFYWNILFSIALYAILFFAAPYIEEFYHDITGLAKILRVQGVILIINAITVVQFNKLRKSMNFKMLARINVSSSIVSVIAAILFASLGAGVWSLVFQQIILSISNCILLWVLCKWYPSLCFSWESLKELFSFGSFIMLSSIVNTIGTNITGLLIGRFFSAAKLGYFSQAKKLEDVTSLGMLQVVDQVTYPMLVEVKNDYHKMASVLQRFNCAVLAFVMPLLFTLAIMAKPVIIILFSEKWLDSVPILQVLCIQGIFIVMQGCNYNAIAAIGQSKAIFCWTIYKRVAMIAILIISLYAWGFSGLLAGLVICGVILAATNMYLVAKYISFSLSAQIKGLLPVMIISTLPFAILFPITCHYDSSIVSCLVGLSYIAIYLTMLFALPTPSIKYLRSQVIDIYNSTIRKSKHNS